MEQDLFSFADRQGGLVKDDCANVEAIFVGIMHHLCWALRGRVASIILDRLRNES